jgi:hypothetical protein
VRKILIALATTIPFVFPHAARADIRVELAKDRYCRSYSALYQEGKTFEPYIINLRAGQTFQVHNNDPYVSLLELISPQGQKVGDFLMEPQEVKEVKVPVTGDYRIELANDKDFYDLRFCAY